MSVEPTYRINVAAELSGVSENLIRAWERRYGVPRPARTGGGYRSYERADIDLLKRLKQLTEQGVPISEAVKLVDDGAGSRRREADPTRWRDELFGAAQRFDQAAIDTLMDEGLRSPPLVFFEVLVAPLLREVGARWHAGTLSISEEHLITNAARQRLISLLSNAPRQAKRHVVCACLPSEQHEVGLLGAALHFRHAGWKVTYLGARTPFAQLRRVVTTVKPDVVALSAIRGGKALDGLVGTLPPGTRVVAGGVGAKRQPDGITLINGPEDWDRLFKEFP
ncbi:MAG: MerR family transcriptional regulator [Archangium sp.]|nr:MerR family transcriptional regulator [Archangium sp.]